MDGLISLNGQQMTPENAKISVLDRGFLFGDNVFEVLVGFGQHVLDLEPHLARLRHSASIHNIPIPWTNDQLRFEINSLVAQLPHPKKYIRLVITRGESIGLAAPENCEPNRIIYVLPAKREPAKTYNEGLRLRRKSLGFTERGPAAKTGNYLRSITALTEARHAGFDDVLWSNSEGEFTEATTSNIFFIGRTGDLVEIATPPPRSGLLLGITRNRIIELLNHAQIPVTERMITVDELARFDEAFLCSTVRGLVPIAAIDRHSLHTVRPNAVFHHIRRLYLTWLESQIGLRVDWNTGEPLTQ
jgi:branched-subunit amino acid aminotransferase/4-amino-4-deoxychorismate lyase